MIKDLPKKLKEQRQIYGLSQRQVAEQLKISPSIISAYETGERTPSAENLLSLSYLYKCSTDYLLGKESATSTYLDVSGLPQHQVQALTELVAAMRE